MDFHHQPSRQHAPPGFAVSGDMRGTEISSSPYRRASIPREKPTWRTVVVSEQRPQRGEYMRDGYVRIESGSGHTVGLTASGRCVVAGDGPYFSVLVGHSSSSVHDKRPPVALVALEDRVQHISCGLSHTILLDSKHRVWGSGANRSGVLGTSGTAPHLRDQIVSMTRPRLVPVTERVVCVASGNGHSLFLDSNGGCWSCGANASGELANGRFGASVSGSVERVRFEDTTAQKFTVRSVFAGGNVSGFIAQYRGDGQCGSTVLLSGSNDDGQLGVGDRVNRCVPTRALLPSSVRGVLCAATSVGGFTLVSCTEAQLFAFGYDGDGACGTRTSETLEPVLVSSLNGAQVRRIALGRAHSVVLANDGKCVLGSGSNHHGQLATVCDRNVNATSFGRITLGQLGLGELCVVDVSCCSNTTNFLLSDGRCVTMGLNALGQRGLTNRSYDNTTAAFFPSIWCAREWQRQFGELHDYPQLFCETLRLCILAWRSPRATQQRVWRRARVGHIPLLLLVRLFSLASLPLERWE